MKHDTKQVQYQGHTYEVPTWVTFIAQDRRGELYGYELDPEFDEEDGEWYCGRSIWVAPPTHPHWTESKEKV
jgi:hypothetical protein